MKTITLAVVIAIAALFVGSSRAAAAEKTIKKEKLQIVFMLGQGEMAGKADVSSTAYMLQKPLVPPREATLSAHKAMPHQINGAYLYWQAMYSYGGPVEKKAELKALIEKRSAFKAAFKQHVLDELEKNDGMFRGKKYAKSRGAYRGGFWLFNMCDQECEEVGLTPKIRAILDATDNTFNVETAYEQLVADANARYRKQLALNGRYLKGTTPEDFAAYAEAVNAYEAAYPDATSDERRHAVAALAERHLHLPLAERTCITGLGTIAGAAAGDSGNVASGKLSVGYGANERSIGLEYAAGLALEQNIEAPILIVKCAWDSRRSIADFWRMPAQEGADSTASQAEEPALGWKRTQAHIRKVLADPGKYHPGYDPKAGFDPAGLIWFQGSHEQNNPEYAAQLASLLTDLRKTVGNPELPVVCATVGTMFFKGESDDHPANFGMRAVAAMSGFKGTVDVMDTYLWRPSELSVIRSLIGKGKIKPDAAMQETLRFSGDGSFYLLTGHEAGSRLAKRIYSSKGTK